MRLRLSKEGLTLVELLVVIGIIAVLAGILWVVLAPARNKARIAHCINNFRQIHMALEIYRQEWDGIDPEMANSFRDLCLPPEPCQVFPTGNLSLRVECVGGLEIWKCTVSRLKTPSRDYSYVKYYISDSEGIDPKQIQKEIEQKFKLRRGDLPIVFDINHDSDGTFYEGLYILILRLNGKIEAKLAFLSKSGSWNALDE
jgi:prepilin-type N-terminal cleavage/methylation domain-containing protein